MRRRVDVAMGAAACGCLALGIAMGHSASLVVAQGAVPADEWVIDRVAYVNTGAGTWSITTAPPLAFVVQPKGGPDHQGGLSVIDLTHPEAPRHLGSVVAPITGSSLAAVNGYVYGKDNQGTGQIVDIRDPTRPRYVGSFVLADGLRLGAIATDREYLIVTAGDVFAVLDVADPEHPRTLGQVSGPIGRPWLAVQGRYVYAPAPTGISVFDIQDPSTPRLHATAELGYTNGVVANNDWLFASVGGLGGVDCEGCWPEGSSLRVLHLDDGRPAEVARLALEAGGVDLAVVSNHLLAANEYGVVDAFDIADPTRPRLIARDRAVGYSLWMEALGDRAIVASGEGVYVLRVAASCTPAGVFRAMPRPAALPDAFQVYLPILVRSAELCQLPIPLGVTAQLGGRAQSVVVAAGHAVIGQGPRVVVFDVAAGKTPAVVGQSAILGGNVTALAAAGQTVFAGDDAGWVSVLDLANPAEPEVIASWRSTLPVRAVAAQGTSHGSSPPAGDDVAHLFVATASTVTVLDVRDPALPHAVGTIDEARGATSLAVREGLLVALSDHVGIRTFDISDPSHVIFAAELLQYSVSAVALGPGVAYLADWENGLQVVDLSDPRHPTVITQPGGIPSISLVVADGRMYELQNDGRIAVRDIANPRLPQWLEAVPSGLPGDLRSRGGTPALAVRDGLTIVVGDDSAGGRVRVVDTRLNTVPAAPSTLDLMGGVTASAPGDGRALLADGDLARLLDLHNPDAPVMEGSWPVDGYYPNMALTDTRAYVALSYSKLISAENVQRYRLDVFDPAVPAERQLPGRLPLDHRVDAIVARGEHAYAASATQVLIIDAADPARPRRVGEIPVSADQVSLAILGSDLFVAGSDGRLSRYDLGDPARPTATSVTALPGPATALATSGPNLLVSMTSDRGPVVALLQPDGTGWPAPISNWSIAAQWIAHLAAGDRRAYVIADAILYVYDLSNPTSPSLIARSRLSFDVHGLLPMTDRLGLATGEGGMRVLRVP